MKVINERSQSKERAGASACPVIRRILKELYMHTYMLVRKKRHREWRAPLTRVMCHAGAFFVLQLLSTLIVRAC